MLAPIMGAVDSRRAALLTERCCTRTPQRARMIILDITGCRSSTAVSAQALREKRRRCGCLGCDVVDHGISGAGRRQLTQLVAPLMMCGSPDATRCAFGRRAYPN